MSHVAGRAWRCEECHRLWVEWKHPGRAHDHVDGIAVCRGQVSEVEIVQYPQHAQALAEIEQLRAQLKHLESEIHYLQAG